MVKMGTVAVINHGKHYKAVWLKASNTAFHCMVPLVYTNGQDCLTLVSGIKINAPSARYLTKESV